MIKHVNEQNVKIVVLENLIVRREIEDSSRGIVLLQTELLVEDGQIIEPKTPVSKTQVLAINDGTVNFNQENAEDARRLFLYL